MAGIDGLWTVSVEVAGSWENGGVVIFDQSRIFGGDGRYYYVGDFATRGDVVTGKTRIVHYSGPRSTGFGESSDFVVNIEGRRSGNVINASISKPQTPGTSLKIRCTFQLALA